MENLGLYLMAIAFWGVALFLGFFLIISKVSLKNIVSKFENILKNPSEQNGLEVMLRVLSNIALMVFFVDRLSVYSNFQNPETIKFYLATIPIIQFFFSLAFGLIMLVIGIDVIKHFTNKNVSLCMVRLYLIGLVILQTILIVPSFLNF